jgi:D-galactarolactone cycloisomerase
MVDANGAWDVPTAVKVGRAMEPLDINWYEEPVCPDDLRGSAEVARKLTTPMAGCGTCTCGRIGFRDYIEAKAIPLVQPDVAWAGGLTESPKIAHMPQAWNLPLAPHIHGSAVAVAAAVHLLAAVPDASMAEIVLPAQPLMADLAQEALVVDRAGHIELSERPGLGIELDARVVAKYRVGGESGMAWAGNDARDRVGAAREGSGFGRNASPLS